MTITVFKSPSFHLEAQEEFEVLGNLLERDSKGGERQEPDRRNYIVNYLYLHLP